MSGAFISSLLDKYRSEGFFQRSGESIPIPRRCDFSLGQWVRVVNGPLMDHDVRVVDVRSGSARVLFDMFGSGREVEIAVENLDECV